MLMSDDDDLLIEIERDVTRLVEHYGPDSWWEDFLESLDGAALEPFSGSLNTSDG
jgi:hypothetical protein